MARICTICTHVSVCEINAALSAGKSNRAVASHYGVSKDAIRRHKTSHMKDLNDSHPLVLSLFPGVDLLGRAFEQEGCCVVQGPDLLRGHNIEDWTIPPAGKFEGVVGGPPCQPFSTAKDIGGKKEAQHKDQIGLFWEIVQTIKPKWAVMENVMGAKNHPALPTGVSVIQLRDWDCGGHTHRKRLFFIWPGELGKTFPSAPLKREGTPSYSVLASSWKSGAKREKRGMLANLSAEDAGRLQGWPEIASTMLRESDGGRLYPKRFVVHSLGNGVPRSMGEWIAKSILNKWSLAA